MHICSCELGKTLMLKDDFEKASEYIQPALEYFKKINDIPSFTKYSPTLAACHRNNDLIDDANNALQNAIKINKSSNITIDIELGIISCIKDRSDKKLKELLKQDMTDDSAAYIYFNCGKILDNKTDLANAEKLYSKLYNKHNDFTYKYYLDKIK